MRIRLSAEAAASLESLPRRVQVGFRDTLDLLRSFPRMFPVRERGVMAGFYAFTVERYIFYYRVSSSEVQIVGILHGMMDEA